MTTYSQLMVAVHKVESEREEARDEVRAKSAMITESVDYTVKLRNQITRLMVALTLA